MGPIGVFDSGYGGLTVLKELNKKLPDYNFLYLGDNARAPYGTRSFETVYHYTRQCVRWLYDQGCPLVILACNTASAKALRNIQQRDLSGWNQEFRVLGVLRPTTEVIGNYTHTGKIGILATEGTVKSESYLIEIAKFFPGLNVYQHGCSLWVPLIENGLSDTPGGRYFIEDDVKKLLKQDKDIDTVLLGCTHYPLIGDRIRDFLPESIRLVSQGTIVADSLADYLDRHADIDDRCLKERTTEFYTTDSTSDFDKHSKRFYGKIIASRQIDIEVYVNGMSLF